MKIKKIIALFLVIFTFTTIVKAAECDINNITFEDIKLVEKTMATNEVGEPTVEGRNIGLNLSMVTVGDSITYSIKVNNSSSEDYQIDASTFNIESDHLDYTISSDDNSNIVPGNSSKTVYLTVRYNQALSPADFVNGTYTSNKVINMNLSTDAANGIENPNTNTRANTFIIGTIVVFVATIAIIVLLKMKKINKYTASLLISLAVLIPITVYAICTCELQIDSDITILQNLVNTIEQKTEGVISPGDEIVIANQEHFYVVSSNDSKTVLLAKYNLYVGEIFINNEYKGRISPTEPYYGIQDRQTLFKSVVGETREVGLVPFSSSTYWLNSNNEIDPKYGSSSTNPIVGVNIYDATYNTIDFEFDKTTLAEDGTCINGICKSTSSNYSIAYYIKNYKTKLEQMGLAVDEVRLLKDTEASALGCGTGNSNYATCPSMMHWLTDGKYWIDGLYNTISPRIIARGQMHFSNYNLIEAGVRPVIVIDTDLIPLLDHDYFVNKPEILY